MDRPLISSMEQMRDFDFVQGFHDVLYGLGFMAQAMLSNNLGGQLAIVSGLAATQTSPSSLSINIGAGTIHTFAAADATTDGSITQDLTQIVQQGITLGQTVTLVPPSVGQSQWNLIQCQFQQGDAIRANDPTAGVVPFYNPSNPTVPNPTTINTVRQGRLVIQVITGAAAATGSEVPPQPTTNWTPLYLVDLAGGQTSITNAQILTAGPSVGTGVPQNYPYAPFLAAFLTSHHSGTPGQAPKINLATEVQGVLPYGNMSSVRQVLTANQNLYVNSTTGNDNNPGTLAAPFATIQAAVNKTQSYDFNGFTVFINIANGNYTAGATVIGYPLGGVGTVSGLGGQQNPPIQFVGNTGSPGSVTINVTNGNCFTILQGACVAISGVTMTASSSGSAFTGFGIAVNTCGVASFQNVIFGACTNAHVVIDGSGWGETTGSYTIAGGAGAHISAGYGGMFALGPCTVTLQGTPNFTSAFIQCLYTGMSQSNGPVTFSGSATGPRYLAQFNGIINVLGAGVNFFPGSVAGAVTLGGQYA